MAIPWRSPWVLSLGTRSHFHIWERAMYMGRCGL